MKESLFVSMRLQQICAAIILSVTIANAQTATPTAPAASATAAATTADASTTKSLPAIFVVGDSTAKNNSGGAQGWGTAIEAYIDPAKATVNNVAHAGQSSRTYYNLATDWPRALPLIKLGDLCVAGVWHQ